MRESAPTQETVTRMTRPIVLVGAMGSGKSTIGARLAAALERPFLDNDIELERATGSTAAVIADRDGVDALHRSEAEVVLRALEREELVVVAAAASTITDDRVRRALRRRATVVWLRAAAPTLVARLPSSTTRPFLGVDAARLVARQARERDPLFAEVADVTVETDTRDPDAVVLDLVDRLGAQPNAAE